MEILRDLHKSVSQGFEASVDNAYKQLNTELALRDARVKAAEHEAAASNEARAKAAAKFKELEHENLILREALRHHETDSTKGLEMSATKSHQMWEAYAPERVLESCSGGEMDNLHPVDTKYRALYGEVQTLIKVSQELRTQVKRYKNKLIRWRDCLNRDEFTLVLDGFPVTFQKLHANDHQTDLRTSNHRSSLEEPLEAGEYTTPAGISMSMLGPHQSPPEFNREGPSARIDGEHSHRLSELCPTLSDCPLKYKEVGPNFPIGQVARPPKRKRASSPQHALTSPSHFSPADDEPGRQITVKVEPISSSPLRNLSQCCEPNPPKTQNLDEIDDSVETPTKRKRNNPGEEHLILVTTTDPSGLDYSLDGAHSKSRRFSPSTQVSRPLQPGGSQLNDRKSNRPLNDESNRRLERMADQGLPSIAEDGDDSYFDIGSRKLQKNSLSNTSMQRPEPSTNSILAQQRLQNLLETPASPRLLRNAPRRSLGSSTEDKKQLRKLDRPVDQDPAVVDGKSLTLPRSLEKHSTQNDLAGGCGPGLDDFKNGLTESYSEDGSYRARSLGKLELNHFKINPNNNDGLDFAFNQVVRKKDGRKSIPGCTRDNCCGDKFLAMARLGGIPVELRNSHQEGPRNIEEATEDVQRLLGAGDNEFKDGLLPEARLIADCYGKHRHEHQRPRTPPGFWRTEMPDTQDLERDHEEARRQEREKVKERFIEARRPGGLWKYADE